MPKSKDTSKREATKLRNLLAERKRRDSRQPPQGLILFCNEFLKTFDPRPDAFPHILPFHLYDYEVGLIFDLYNAITQGYDLFIEKSRDMGVSWTILAVLFWCWLNEPGFQAIVGSRKEDYVDNHEIDSLFGKLDFFIDQIVDPEIMPADFKKRIHRNYMKLSNPENKNAIIGESSNPSFSRAGRYKVAVFDEFGFWKDAKSAWGAAGDSAKCRIAITTPPDVPSYAKAVRFEGRAKVITLHWKLHPNKTQEWYEGECKRRTPEEVQHELDISWEYSASGRPYPEVDTISFGNHQYDPALPLYISIDLGLDAVALGWYQPVQNSDWWTLVEAFEKSDKIIDWFFPFFGRPVQSGAHTYTDDELAFIDSISKWREATVFGDPSGKAKHIESNESAYHKLALQGVYVQMNDKENVWLDRRDATKRLLPRLQVNETPRTRWWHECMKLAHFPKRPEESQSTTPIIKPVHDFTSHHRTQTEFFAVNYKRFPQAPGEQRKANARKREYDSSGRLIS